MVYWSESAYDREVLGSIPATAEPSNIKSFGDSSVRKKEIRQEGIFNLSLSTLGKSRFKLAQFGVNKMLAFIHIPPKFFKLQNGSSKLPQISMRSV